MANESQSPLGVMEGGGSYNLHAKIPASGATLALPSLEKAIGDLSIDADDQPVIIADYGSSQGKNSLVPMSTAIRTLRARLGPDRPIFVVHVDQHANDFNTLFALLHNDPGRYALDDPNVFPQAIGRSFYESVFPKGHVHLGWSSYAAVWLSRVPMAVPGHFIALAATGDVRVAFDHQAAEDWQFFLSLRARELRAGGRLVVVLPGLSDDGDSGFALLFNAANEALAEMVLEHALSATERGRMVLAAYPRRRAQLLAPFASAGEFADLVVESCDVFPLPDPAWPDFERDANNELLAARHAAFFRAVFIPSLASALADRAQTPSFSDDLERRLKKHLSRHPAPFHSFVQNIVLAKRPFSRAPQ